MQEKTTWKQPTPTDINFDSNFDALDRAVFREILSLCQNADYLSRFEHASRRYSIELKRGQCIFKVAQFAKEMKNDAKRVRKSIENLSKWYTEMESKAMPYGLIVTIKDYDELTKMDNGKENRRRIEGEQKENRRRANINKEDNKDNKDQEDIITPKPTVSVAYASFINFLNEKTGKKFRYTDKKACTQLQARLREGYTREDFEKAITNCVNDSFHKENNLKYLTPEFITRSDKFTKYLNAEKPVIKTENRFLELIKQKQNQ